jgi:hypothetical protein
MARVTPINAGANGHGRSTPFDAADGDVTVLERAAVRRLTGRDIAVDRSMIGAAHAERATISQSTVGVVAAKSLALDEVRAGVLIAPVVRGDVHTLVDMRTAVALGFGMVLGQAFLRGAQRLQKRLGS